MYLITTNIQDPFITKWYDYENCFNPDVDMVVYDLDKNEYTKDGINWKEIEEDHL